MVCRSTAALLILALALPSVAVWPLGAPLLVVLLAAAVATVGLRETEVGRCACRAEVGREPGWALGGLVGALRADWQRRVDDADAADADVATGA